MLALSARGMADAVCSMARRDVALAIGYRLTSEIVRQEIRRQRDAHTAPLADRTLPLDRRLLHDAPMTIRQMPPRGHYLAHEAGRLAGVSGRMIGQWARRGYVRSSQSDESPRIYSYQDVAEAMVVHELIEAGVSHQTIRDAIAHLREKHPLDWPLSHARLSVPAGDPGEVKGRPRKKRTVVAQDGPVGIDTSSGHPVLDGVDLVDIAVDLRRGGWAARRLPDLIHIEVDPDRFSGRPVIAGSRIPAEDVARLAERQDGRRILIAEYGLTEPQIHDAVRWWQQVRDFDSQAA